MTVRPISGGASDSSVTRMRIPANLMPLKSSWERNSPSTLHSELTPEMVTDEGCRRSRRCAGMTRFGSTTSSAPLSKIPSETVNTCPARLTVKSAHQGGRLQVKVSCAEEWRESDLRSSNSRFEKGNRRRYGFASGHWLLWSRFRLLKSSTCPCCPYCPICRFCCRCCPWSPCWSPCWSP